MADTTTVMALPFPEWSDANDVPADMQALAERLDEVPVTTAAAIFMTGSQSGLVAAATSTSPGAWRAASRRGSPPAIPSRPPT